MTSNFLEDVIGFLSEQSALDPGGECRFHQPVTTAGDAAYHDMAERFGFGQARAAYRYRCRLQGVHGNGACLADFAGRLRGFFDGEHPTRVTYFDYQGDLSETRPARTIYTGNYVLRPECLDWFIPFAGLKLRMAGPVLGRLLKAELGPHFVSANLPMLHQRTLDKTGLSECRPGVDQAAEQIDLSGEFERQYFGDLMLFGIERLTASGYPAKDLPAAEVLQALTEVEAGLRQSYLAKQTEVLAKSETLRALLQDAGPRWQQPEWARGRERFAAFLDSIEHNFGADSPGWALIDDPEHCRARLRQLTSAIGEFGADRAASAGGYAVNVFVLNSGRARSTTFIRACSHICNYSAGHESRVQHWASSAWPIPPTTSKPTTACRGSLAAPVPAKANPAWYSNPTPKPPPPPAGSPDPGGSAFMKAYPEANPSPTDRRGRDLAPPENYRPPAKANMPWFASPPARRSECSVAHTKHGYRGSW